MSQNLENLHWAKKQNKNKFIFDEGINEKQNLVEIPCLWRIDLVCPFD